MVAQCSNLDIVVRLELLASNMEKKDQTEWYLNGTEDSHKDTAKLLREAATQIRILRHEKETK